MPRILVSLLTAVLLSAPSLLVAESPVAKGPLAEGPLAKDRAIAGKDSAPPPAKYQGRRISLDLQDASIENALRIISEVANLNIVTSPEVHGEVTLRLIDVPWDQALDVILRTHGLYAVREGNVLMIVPLKEVPHLYFAE